MKKILLFFVLAFTINLLQAQEGSQAPAAKLAHHIADKMKDSLGLTNQQRAKIFGINKDLFDQKDKARKKSTDRAKVGREMQQIENTRDGEYKKVLTGQQYALYKQKKRTLVSAQ